MNERSPDHHKGVSLSTNRHAFDAFVPQLLRCELDGAREDLVSVGHRAEERARKEADRAKERERALQAKMGARLRAAEAEAAAAEKRMADFKR